MERFSIVSFSYQVAGGKRPSAFRVNLPLRKGQRIANPLTVFRCVWGVGAHELLSAPNRHSRIDQEQWPPELVWPTTKFRDLEHDIMQRFRKEPKRLVPFKGSSRPSFCESTARRERRESRHPTLRTSADLVTPFCPRREEAEQVTSTIGQSMVTHD